MKIRIGFLLLYLLIAFPCLIIAQERAILDWSFFKNDRPADVKYQAYTWSNVGYRYKPLKSDGDKMEIQFTVTFKMDIAKSYCEVSQIKANNLKLLKHEQGHADIGFIYAMKLKKLFESTSFSKVNYQQEIKNIWTNVFSEMTNEQARYDIETNHLHNVKVQKQWDLYFEEATRIN
ncbi:MAG: DUF922 domain-containing protein [Pedobacter sp.]|nr:MAG: DUF922 domain-containing protein [Pedobacter sp.]